MQETIADMLQNSRIPWTRIEKMGVDIESIIQEAAAAGDFEVIRRARRYLASRR